MNRLVLVLALASCKKSTQMPAIPDASVDRWVAAMAAVCVDPKPEPVKNYVDNPIAAAEVHIPCTPRREWKEVEQNIGGMLPLGGLIQLDDDGAPNRMELMVVLREGQANPFARRFLAAYGIPDKTVKKISGGGDFAFHDDIRVFVDKHNHLPGNAVVAITIDNQND